MCIYIRPIFVFQLCTDYIIFNDTNMSRVPDQSGVSQACYIVEMYHSGPKPSMLSVCVHVCQQFMTFKFSIWSFLWNFISVCDLLPFYVEDEEVCTYLLHHLADLYKFRKFGWEWVAYRNVQNFQSSNSQWWRQPSPGGLTWREI